MYREPFGGTPAVLAALPIDRIEPTPYQRDPSQPHVKRLMTVIETLGRFLDPIISVRRDDGYWTPNGNHRLQAMRKLGAKSVIALVVPDPEVAFKILALNTEKAHNLKEKSLETIRMLRALADERSASLERELAFEFDQPSFLTLGAAYEQRPRLSGGAYNPVLRRIEDFLDERLPRALKERTRRAGLILAIDDHVTAIVGKLKARGFTSPIFGRSWSLASIRSAFRRPPSSTSRTSSAGCRRMRPSSMSSAFARKMSCARAAVPPRTPRSKGKAGPKRRANRRQKT